MLKVGILGVGTIDKILATAIRNSWKHRSWPSRIR